MKVILLQDVAKVGRRFELATVPDGYAMNQLIPKGMAEAATPENMKRLKAKTAKSEQATEEAGVVFADALKALEGKKLLIKTELNEQGHMFEALKAGAVVEAAAQEGAVLEETHITITDPIKESGEHTITLTHGDETGSVVVSIEAK